MLDSKLPASSGMHWVLREGATDDASASGVDLMHCEAGLVVF